MSNSDIASESKGLLRYQGESGRLLLRQAKGMGNLVLSTLAAVLGVSILFIIFGHILINGISSIDWNFFTQTPAPVGESGGGIANAIIGTFMMLIVAGLIAVPIAFGTAIYIVEYGRGRFASIVRFSIELLAELPSIVVGIFVWSILVRNMHTFSGLAGSIALAIIMIPIIARSVEEILHLVPDTLREGALALGTPRWLVILQVVIPTVLPGLLTGIVLSLARAAGETAPLMLTALGNQFFSVDMSKEMASIPVQIYNYATSAYHDQNQKAWGATLILVAVVAVLSGIVRFVVRGKKHES